MSFRTQAEMDRNARRWLAMLLLLVLAGSTIGAMVVVLGWHGEDIIGWVASVASGHPPR